MQDGRGKRLKDILCYLLSAICVLPFGTTFAGEYHNVGDRTATDAETLVCAQCHSMHGTQGGQSMIYGGAPTVYPVLLRAAGIIQLCRTCHEANSLGMSNPTPPDIWNNTLGYVASAGDFNDRNLSFLNEANRHSVDTTTVTPPGSNPPFSISYFSCISCHDQHGNRNYRNLKKRPGNATSDITINYRLNGSGNCSDNTLPPCDVNNVTTTGLPAGAPNLYKYNRGNVGFIKASSNTNSIAPWCGGCHTNFHGAGGASNMGGSITGDIGNPWLRHPVRDVDINEGNTNLHVDRINWAGISATARVRVVNPDDTVPTVANADEQPFCLPCHYAHGGGNPNNVTNTRLDHSNIVFIDGNGNPNMDPSYNTTTGYIRNLCQQCHNQ